MFTTKKYNDYAIFDEKGGHWPSYFPGGCYLWNVRKFRDEEIRVLSCDDSRLKRSAYEIKGAI